MQEDMKQATKEWVENWKRVGPILEQMKYEELRKPDYHKELEGLLGMIDLACKQSEPSKTSGLVEQQRLFMKMREQMEGRKP
jgi:hypothetical protein